MKQYNVTEIAEESGVSKATVSRWLSKNNVTPAETNNKEKFYSETILKRFLSERKGSKSKANTPSRLELLQNQVDELMKQNEVLARQLEIKDKQIEALTVIAKQSQALSFADKTKELNEPGKEKEEKKGFWHFFNK